MSFRVYEEANDVKYATTRSRGQIRKTYHVDPPGSQKPGDHFIANDKDLFTLAFAAPDFGRCKRHLPYKIRAHPPEAL